MLPQEVKTQVQTAQTSITISASLMLSISSVALFVAWGMMAVVAGLNSADTISSVPSATGAPMIEETVAGAQNYDGYLVEFEGEPLITMRSQMERRKLLGQLTEQNFQGELRKAKSAIDTQHQQMKTKIFQRVPNVRPQETRAEGPRKPRLEWRHEDPEGPINSTLRREFTQLFNGLALDILDSEVKLISAIPGVKAVHKNYRLSPVLGEAVGVIAADDAGLLDASGGPCGLSGQPCLSGQGVKVGIIDTGIDPFHEALGATSLPPDYRLQRITGQKISHIIPLSFEYQTIDLHGNQLAAVNHSPKEEDRHSIALYTLTEEASPAPVEFILTPPGIIPFKVALNEHLLAYYAWDWNNRESVRMQIITPVALYVYDFITQEHTRIASYFPSDESVPLAVAGKRVIYTREYKNAEINRTQGNIFVYDAETGREHAIAEPIYIFEGFKPYLPIVFDNLVVSQQFSRFNNYCAPGGAEVYNLDTPAASFTLPNFTGPIMDFNDEWILASTCEEQRGENRYYLSHRITGEAVTVAEQARVPIYFYGNWSHRGKIGNGVVFFNRLANYLHAFDLIGRRTVLVNPSVASTAFAVDGRRVCFIENEGESGSSAVFSGDRLHVYCHTFDPDKPYEPVDVYNQKVIGGYNFHTEGFPPLDNSGHGTHVAGIVAGNGRLRGVAPGATLLAYKVGHSGGTDETIIAALERAIQDGAQVINISLGGAGSATDPIARAVDATVETGVTVVVAAGNSGPDGNDDCHHPILDAGGEGARYSICSPGVARKAITVGATSKQDRVAGFSSRGPVLYFGQDFEKPDVVAPGVAICSSRYNFMPMCAGSEEYALSSGTSMASPMVAGTAAILKERFSDWTPEQIKQRLMETAKDIGEAREAQGAGRIDVLAALGGMVFLRGDSNGDGRVDISDAVYTLNVLFVDSSLEIFCDDAADSNDDGRVDISDAVYTLNYLFTGMGDITAPGALVHGPDPTADNIGCKQYL